MKGPETGEQSVHRHPTATLATVTGRPSDLEPMQQAVKFDPLPDIAKLEALREQVTAASSRASESAIGSDPGQAAVQLAQAVKAAMLGEGADAAAQLLKAPGSPTDRAQPRTVSHLLTPVLTADAAMPERRHLPPCCRRCRSRASEASRTRYR